MKAPTQRQSAYIRKPHYLGGSAGEILHVSAGSNERSGTPCASGGRVASHIAVRGVRTCLSRTTRGNCQHSAVSLDIGADQKAQ